MAYVQIKDVYFSYPNGNPAVENVSLSIGRGERIAIIGQNGAGKTTLAKLVNGLLKPSKGEILIDNKSTRGLSAAKIARHVGYCFQNPDDQIFSKDVHSEIAYGPRKMNFDEAEVEKRVLSSAKLCMIDSLLNEHPYNLSLSTRKIVAIASVIAMGTEVVILDEPTAGQDRKAIDCIARIINHLSQQGQTVITITHNLDFVADNFNRCVVMANKCKIADGETKSIFWDPDVLAQANLKQPCIASLCRKVGIHEKIISIKELLSYLESQRLVEVVQNES